MSKRYKFYNVLRICREDIAEATNQATANRLTEDDMVIIAEDLHDGLLEGGFWDVLADIVDLYVHKKYPEGGD